MLSLPNIDPDKVRRYGDQFFKLIDTARIMMNPDEDEPHDPNRHIVINLASDDEEEPDGADGYGGKGNAAELRSRTRSAYFQAPAVVARNAQCAWNAVITRLLRPSPPSMPPENHIHHYIGHTGLVNLS
jgi:hypothetical protein